MLSRFLLLISVFVIVAGCTTTAQLAPQEPKTIHIVSVSVTVKKGITPTASFTQNFETALANHARVWNRYQTGRVEGYHLNVQLEELHYKNPIMSLIIGDANSMATISTLTDPTDQSELKKFKTIAVDGASAILNGVSGAVLSVTVDKSLPEQNMIKAILKPLMRDAYKMKISSAYIPRDLKKVEPFTPSPVPLSPLSPVSEPVTDSVQPSG